MAFAPANAVDVAVFEDEAAQRGFVPYETSGMTTGLSAADFNGDGYIDFFVPTAAGMSDQLYLNLGDGTVREISLAAGVSDMLQSRAALWFDYDGDHDLDLVVGRDCSSTHPMPAPCDPPVGVTLYEQLSDGTFADVTIGSGLEETWGAHQTSHFGGMAAADINNDGYLDLYLCGWNRRATMYLNNGDGTFTDNTFQCGMSFLVNFYWQPLFADFNRDGWIDLFVGIDFNQNELWINDGDGTFTNRAAEAGVNSAWNEMGGSLGDFNNDGDIDIYVTNITDYEFTPGGHNRLYSAQHDDNGLHFVDVAEDSGVADGRWGWGATWIDANLDGWLDIATTNGFPGDYVDDTSRFFLNMGPKDGIAKRAIKFANVSDLVNFNDNDICGSLISFDFDRDGDPDLLQQANLGGPIRLLINRAADTNNWLVVKPRMRGTNHFAIGAQVNVTVGDRVQAHVIGAGTSSLGQEPAEALIGLGDAMYADRVEIFWPGGGSLLLTDVEANQMLTVSDCPDAGRFVVPDCTTHALIGDIAPRYDDDTFGDGVVDVDDILAIILAMGHWGGRCDINSDGTVDHDDLAIVIDAMRPKP
ncbi:MAG: CRTAC1 family protein [Planctomycetota bacterium]